MLEITFHLVKKICLIFRSAVNVSCRHQNKYSTIFFMYSYMRSISDRSPKWVVIFFVINETGILLNQFNVITIGHSHLLPSNVHFSLTDKNVLFTFLE